MIRSMRSATDFGIALAIRAGSYETRGDCDSLGLTAMPMRSPLANVTRKVQIVLTRLAPLICVGERLHLFFNADHVAAQRQDRAKSHVLRVALTADLAGTCIVDIPRTRAAIP